VPPVPVRPVAPWQLASRGQLPESVYPCVP
jgi:hypothetical protein